MNDVFLQQSQERRTSTFFLCFFLSTVVFPKHRVVVAVIVTVDFVVVITAAGAAAVRVLANVASVTSHWLDQLIDGELARRNGGVPQVGKRCSQNVMRVPNVINCQLNWTNILRDRV